MYNCSVRSCLLGLSIATVTVWVPQVYIHAYILYNLQWWDCSICNLACCFPSKHSFSSDSSLHLCWFLTVISTFSNSVCTIPFSSLPQELCCQIPLLVSLWYFQFNLSFFGCWESRALSILGKYSITEQHTHWCLVLLYIYKLLYMVLL